MEIHGLWDSWQKVSAVIQSPISFPRIVPAASAEDPRRGLARSWGEEEAVGAPPAGRAGGAV